MFLKYKDLNGYLLAAEIHAFNLNDIFKKGAYDWSTIIFKTASGAVYKIFEKSEDSWVIVKRHGNTYPISKEQMARMKIRKGESFYYPNGNTSPVSRIWGICENFRWEKLDCPELVIIDF